MCSRRIMAVGFGICALVAGVFGTVVSADHSWGNYHWARQQNPFTLMVVNSTTDDWDSYVGTATNNWSSWSAALHMTEINGSTSDKDRRQCVAPSGMIRICNLAYGYNGWLGIAGISIDASGHIFRGYTKLNDSYFRSSYYNKDSWKQSVACQELGHNVGLDHQDENFDSEIPKESCMDYQDPPWPTPNPHDTYELDNVIYNHLDSYDSFAIAGEDGGDGGGTCTAPPGKGCNKSGVGQGNDDHGWGISLGRRGAKEKFLRIDHDGTRHITFVTWAAGH